MHKFKGFTLLEILVVVAILAILSSLIFYFVNDAKIKGNDSAIKQNMKAISNQAALFYATYKSFKNPSSAGAYDGYCSNVQQDGNPVMLFQDKIIHRAIVESIKLSDRTQVVPIGLSLPPPAPPNTYYQYSRCYNSANVWAVAVLLRSGNSSSNPSNPYKAWCVDSTETSKIVEFINLPMGINTNIISSAGQCL